MSRLLSLRRGREYYKDGRVELAVFRDGVYAASVAGSDDYSVAVELRAELISGGRERKG